MDDDLIGPLIQAFPALKDTAAILVEKAKDWKWRFDHREVLFLEDRAEMDAVLSIDKNAEMASYKAVITDDRLLVLARIGIRLRQLAEKKDFDKIATLRQSIVQAHGTEGVRAAQAIQAGVLYLLINEDVLGRFSGDPSKDAEDILLSMDTAGFFIEDNEDPIDVANRILDYIRIQRPAVFVLGGAGWAAPIAEKAHDHVYVNASPDYDWRDARGRGRFVAAFYRKT